MLLYTWKDVERKLLLNKKVWEDKILEIETYSSEIIIYIKSMDVINDVEMLLCELMDHKYDQQNKKINLEFEGEYLDVFFEQGDIVEHNVSGTPLFKKVLYQQSAYYNVK